VIIDEQRNALYAAAARLDDPADLFCAWWADAYPAHNSGVLNRVRDCDREAALVLLTGRTVERAQAMTAVLWAAPEGYLDGYRLRLSPNDRTYIATSDRSICVLLTKATVIEREVIRLGLDRPDEGNQTEHVDDALVEHIRRVGCRLHDWLQKPLSDTSGSLAKAIARVAQEVSAIELGEDRLVGDYRRRRVVDRLEQMDVELLREARSATDVEMLREMRRQANEELGGNHQAVVAPTEYLRWLEAKVDQQLRHRYGFPTFMCDVASADSDESHHRQARTGTDLP
jgi:hypothetical protein